MKKIFTFVVAAMTAISSFAWSYETPGFEWSVGADITSSYLWRGMKYGGVAFQPDVSIGYAGLSIEAWANLSPKDNTWKVFNPELDITLQYSVAGLTVGATHYYYFDGTRYFDYRKPSIAAYEAGEYATNQTEVFAKFELGEILENVPLTVLWSTFVGGDDWKEKYEDPTDDEAITGLERAFSSYLEVSYEIGLPLGFSLTPTVGMTPWASFYNYYKDAFSVNNVSLKLNWEVGIKDVFTIDVYGIAMLNTAGINKDNVWPAISRSYGEQRLNLAVGAGFWF
jgi:hypothetical protein